MAATHPVSEMILTPSSNTENFPEGMAPSAVNDSARDLEAAIRGFYEDIEWRDMGHTPTRTGNTTFTIAADVTASYITGRRIRCADSSTIYGTIVTSSYSAPNTTVTIMEGTGNLSASLTAVALGYIPSNQPVPVRGLYLPNLNLALPPDLLLIRPTVATVDIDWTLGGLFLENGSNVVYKETGNLTVDLTASGANGLDTGAEGASTWYHIWCIYNPATNTLAGLLSTSATSPTLPSGYTYTRLVGAVYNNSGSNLVDFRQIRQNVYYAQNQAAVADLALSGSYAASALSVFVPSTASEVLISMIKGTTDTGNSTVLVSFDGTNDYATIMKIFSNETYFVTVPILVPIVSQQLYFKEDVASVSTYNLYVNGFKLMI